MGVYSIQGAGQIVMSNDCQKMEVDNHHHDTRSNDNDQTLPVEKIQN